MSVKITKVPDMVVDLSFSRKELAEIGLEVRSLMAERTQNGYDIKDRKFKPYSKLNEKSGTPNLTDTGRMLGNLHSGLTSTGVMVNLKDVDQNDKGVWHQDGVKPHMIRPKRKKALKFSTSNGVMFSKGHEVSLPQREWFGLSRKDEQKLFKKVVEPIMIRKVK